jgi:hypothetical protein
MSEKKQTISIVASPKGQVEAEDLDFKPTKEEWNAYELEDGTRLRVRAVVGKVSRGIDPETKKTYILANGEPLYSIKYKLEITADVPRKTLQKLKGS